MKQAIALSAGVLFASACPCAPVVFDFSGLPVETPTFTNTDYRGGRISPHCHYDIVSPQPQIDPPGVSTTFGFDAAGCSGPDPVFNPNYLGPNAVGANVYID